MLLLTLYNSVLKQGTSSDFVIVCRFKVQLSSIDISVMENGFQSNSVSDCGV